MEMNSFMQVNDYQNVGDFYFLLRRSFRSMGQDWTVAISEPKLSKRTEATDTNLLLFNPFIRGMVIDVFEL